jgi:hypothetical protein
MSDFLPVEDATPRTELHNHDVAVQLGVAPKGRFQKVQRVCRRPGISPKMLPTKKGVERLWPHLVARAHGSIFERFEDGMVRWLSGAHMVINGSPVAYHPFNQKSLGKIEEQRARGFANLVKDERGELVRQGHGDPVPGHLVCRTAYQRPEYAETDQRRYLDPNTTPFISLPLELMLNWRDEYPKLLGAQACISDRQRGGYTIMAVVGDVDLHGIGGVSKYIWERMALGGGGCTAIQFEFQVWAGKPAEGFTLQRWQV